MKKGISVFLVFLVLLFFTGCTLVKKTFSPTIIENRIRTILEVPTVEYVYREILYFGKEARFLGIKHMDKRLLFSVDIILQAGFNLEKEIQIKRTINGGILITLPEPEILIIDVDENSIHQFFIKEWGGKISRLDYYDELNKRKKSIKQDAIKRGILIKARENGSKMIRGLLRPLKFQKIQIHYKTGVIPYEES